MTEGIEEIPKFEIILATAGDAEGILNLLRSSVMNAYPNKETGITEEDVAEYYKDEFSEKGLKKLSEELGNPESGVTNFVAKNSHGIVVGYCRVAKRTDMNELKRIHVLPSRTRSGIGKALWEQAQTVLDPNKDTVLWVVDSNQGSIDIYEKKWRFVRSGEHKEISMKSGAIRREIEMVRKALPASEA